MSADVEPRSTVSSGWYFSWKKRNGIANARRSAPVASRSTRSRRVRIRTRTLDSASAMASRVFWRRSATAAWVYAAVVFGILGTVVAARVLGLEEFGIYVTALAAVGFFQVLLDLTVEEPLTKFGFRYIVARGVGEAPPALRASAPDQVRRRSPRGARARAPRARLRTRSSAPTGLRFRFSWARSCPSCRRRRTWGRQRFCSEGATTCGARIRRSPWRCA